MNRNLLRKSYFFNKFFFKKMTRIFNLVKQPYLKKKKRIKVNSLFINLRPNNTFITYSGEPRLHNITGGTSGFKGPKRSSPYSRFVVAKNMSYFLYKNRIKNQIDLYFKSQISRKFFFFLKGLLFRRMKVRYILKSKLVAHGYIRARKKRRK